MLDRGENGKLKLDTNSLALFINELYSQCKTQEEVDFLKENLVSVSECEAETREEEIEDGKDNN